ncbi:MAG: YncE family protein [Corynebacterium sp.]|nr:YncE family protein [Corynebacterium sp.]
MAFKNSVGGRAVAAALAGALSLGIASSVVVAPHAVAVQASAVIVGKGTLTVKNTDSAVKAGGTLQIEMSGFPESAPHYALKLDKKAIATDQADDNVTVKDGESYLTDSALAEINNGSGNGTFKFTIPADTTEGEHVLYILTNGNSVSVGFTVSASATEVAAGASASAKFNAVSVNNGTATGTVAATLSSFPANTAVGAYLDGDTSKTLKWAAQGRGAQATDTKTTDAQGAVSGNLSIDSSGLGAGTTHTITFTYEENGTAKTVDATYTAGTSASFLNDDAALGTKAVLGTKGTVTVVGLASGSTITDVKFGDTKVNSANVAASGSYKDTVAIEIPSDNNIANKNLTITYTDANGASHTDTISTITSVVNTENNADKFTVSHVDVDSGLYQSVYSTVTNQFYVSASGNFYVVDPTTGEVLKQQALPGTAEGGFNVFGIGLDQSTGDVWVTNTRNSTVAVYDKDLNLKKQWAANTASGARDIKFDSKNGIAWVSSPTAGKIWGFKAGQDTPVATLDATQLGTGFGPMSLTLDETNNILYTVSLNTKAAAKIDLSNPTNPQVTTWDLSSVSDTAFKTGAGVAYNSDKNLVYVTSQAGNSVVVIDPTTGTVADTINIGDGGLNAVYNAPKKQLYIASRAGSNLTVINTEDNSVVANLNMGLNVNHASVDPNGDVLVVNKANRDGKDSIYKVVYTAASSNVENNSTDTNNANSNTDTAKKTGFAAILEWIKSHILVVGGIFGLLAVLAGVGAAVQNGQIVLPQI